MRHLLNADVVSINIDSLQNVMKKIAQRKDVIDLTFGQPNFATPDYIKNAGIQAIQNNHTGYTPTIGILELRKAASLYMNRLYGLDYDPNKEIIVTIGASEALDLTFRTILDEDSEVIIPTPVYVGYEPLIQISKGKAIYVNTVEHDFKINAELIEQNLTDKTRAIILPYPNNPMGALLSKKELKNIARLLKDKDIFIVADEVYSELTFTNRHQTIASFKEVRDRTILINGLSKSHAMTGWRIGFAFAPNYLIEQFLKIKMFNTVCATSISQYAAVTALMEQKESDRRVKEMKEEYKKRRDYVYGRLQKMKIDVTLPEGAFYIFPSIQQTGLSSMEFVIKLLEEEKVAVIPGNAFSSDGEGFIRISFAQSMDELEKGMDGVEQFLKQF